MRMSSRYRKQKSLTLKYIVYTDPSNGYPYRLPMAHVILKHKKIIFPTAALIDSGATSTFLPRDFAEILHLDLSKEPDNAVCATGNFETISSLLDNCSLIKGKSSVFESFENMIVTVPVKLNTLPYMVLGRNSIFKRFSVKFLENQQKINLKRV